MAKNIHTIAGTYKDAITGLYVNDKDIKPQYMVVCDRYAHAIFNSKIEALEFILKSEEKNLYIEYI